MRIMWTPTVVLLVGVVLAVPLWREFTEPGQPAWSVFLASFLIGVVAAWLGLRCLKRHRIEVGEARLTSAATEHDRLRSSQPSACA
ncbi:hypothetical protein [Sphingomonas sp.]|uniref:hypothetical protein n=1 Tax=Sphingomonas sp. TaxID=28214 RepID=UPI003CC687F9